MSEDPHWPRASAWLASGGSVDGRHLVVAGVPCARSSISPSRADTTPSAVRAALRRYSTFDADLDVDLERLRVTDAGDLPVHELAGEELVEATEAGLRALPAADLVVLLGGDNALTRPAARALLPDLRRGALLTLDAHHDVRGLHDGPTNGTPVRGLVEDGLPGGNVVQVGIGALTNSRAYRTWCVASWTGSPAAATGSTSTSTSTSSTAPSCRRAPGRGRVGCSRTSCSRRRPRRVGTRASSASTWWRWTRPPT